MEPIKEDFVSKRELSIFLIVNQDFWIFELRCHLLRITVGSLRIKTIILLWWRSHFSSLKETINESPSKNPDIKTPLVAKNEWQLPAKNSPLAAFWCQGFSQDSHYISILMIISDDLWKGTMFLLLVSFGTLTIR